jgi:hypothetical protein
LAAAEALELLLVNVSMPDLVGPPIMRKLVSPLLPTDTLAICVSKLLENLTGTLAICVSKLHEKLAGALAICVSKVLEKLIGTLGICVSKLVERLTGTLAICVQTTGKTTWHRCHLCPKQRKN